MPRDEWLRAKQRDIEQRVKATEYRKLVDDEGEKPATRPHPHVTDLWTAIERDNVLAVEGLLAKGVAVDAPGSDGWSPLHYAAETGHEALARLLIRKGADVDSRERGWTPLHIAVCKGNMSIAKVLISNGADIDARDKDGETALSHAVHGGREPLVELLMKGGADPNTADNCGRTPLHRAVMAGNERVAEFLVRNGADIHARDRGDDTPLSLANYAHRHKLADLLLDNARPTAAQQIGRSVERLRGSRHLPDLWEAATHRRDLSEVKALIEGGVDVNLKCQGETVLHWSAREGDYDLTKLLIQSRADVNVEDSDGDTPLHWAAIKGHGKIAELLVRGGADVNTRNIDRDTPLHRAVANDHHHVVSLMLRHDSDVNSIDDAGNTPLHLAAARANKLINLLIVKLLIDSGADLNAKNGKGWTPLDRTQNGDMEAFLRKRGGKSGKELDK